MSDVKAPPMNGLDMARHMLAQGGQPPIGRTLDFACVEVDEGRAVFVGDPQPNTFNPMGTVHGGYAATLLDSACGIAVFTKLAAGQSMTTLELKVAYHRSMTDKTGPVRAEGIVVSMGRRVAFVEGKLTDSDGQLLASATSTLLVVSQ